MQLATPKSTTDASTRAGLIAQCRRYTRLQWCLGGLLVAIAVSPSVDSLITYAAADAERTTVLPPVAGMRIAAPGRIEPRDGVITLAASSHGLGPAIVQALHVRAGQWVEEGQLLVTLQGLGELQAALISSERRVAVAEARLSAMQAGAKREDIEALQLEIEGDEANLARLTADTRRTEQLHRDRMVSVAAVETQQARLSAATQLAQAKRARLKSLSSVHPAEVAVGAAEVDAARAEADTMRAKLEGMLVRAPSAGRVLALHARPGEYVGSEGILSFGRTDEIFIDAELTEDDIARVRVGQRASIKSDVLPSVAEGTVEEVGYIVGSRQIFTNDPTAFVDSRIVHVKVRVDDPALFERFINARVTVELAP